jgi:hypothetical protein
MACSPALRGLTQMMSHNSEEKKRRMSAVNFKNYFNQIKYNLT